MTYADDIEKHAEGEEITAVVIGEMGWGDYNEESKPVPLDKKGTVLTWAEARPLLDYEYDDGYGAPDCHAVAVYTSSRVIMTYQYDGATGLFDVMRNPSAFMPEMPGG